MAKKIPGIPGRKRLRKSIVRTASKSMEKKMIGQAKIVFNNPLIIIPSYDDSESRKAFRKLEKQLEKLNKQKDNPKKLEKISNKRNLISAVAGTMLVAHAEKAPYLAAASLPTGSVTYAQRGNAQKEHLIAVQNVEDPFLRLLSIKDVVLKHDLHVYSWDDGFLSTGKQADPPQDFITFVLKQINLTIKNSIALCPHLKESMVKNKNIETEPYLRIHWKSANVIIGICKQCTQKRKNTLFDITKFLIEPSIAEDFSASVIGELIKNEKTNTESEFYIDDYSSGKITDKEFIEKNMQKRSDNLKDSDQQLFILDNISYADDTEKFIEALRPNKSEKIALTTMLKNVQGPFIINDATPNVVLDRLWEDHAKSFLSSIIDDDALVEELLSLHETPSTIVETAFTYKQRKNILDQLPKYSSLPEIIEFTDRIARLYRTRSKQRVFTELKKGPDSTKAKAITYGFLLAIDKAKDMKWKFSQVEIESGEFLRSYIDNLLNADPGSYHDALQQVINASGSSDDLSRYKIND